MSNESDALKALDKIEKSLQPIDTKGASQKELCTEYKKIKKFLEKALGLIEKIPVYGKKIATAIKFLMHIADTICV